MGDDLETVVLRERYSTRALARKARELADREDAPAQPLGPIVEETIEVADSGAVLISESNGVPVAVAAGAIDVVGGRRRGDQEAGDAAAPAPAREPGLAGGHGEAVRAGLDVGRHRAAHDAGAGSVRRDRAPIPAPASARDRAAVADGAYRARLESSGSDGHGQAGRGARRDAADHRPARGSAPVELVLDKTGYLPLNFKVLPHQDREVTAALEHVPPPPPPEEPVAVRPGRRGIERPSRAAGWRSGPRADHTGSGNVRAGAHGGRRSGAHRPARPRARRTRTRGAPAADAPLGFRPQGGASSPKPSPPRRRGGEGFGACSPSHLRLVEDRDSELVLPLIYVSWRTGIRSLFSLSSTSAWRTGFGSCSPSPPRLREGPGFGFSFSLSSTSAWRRGSG